MWNQPEALTGGCLEVIRSSPKKKLHLQMKKQSNTLKDEVDCLAVAIGTVHGLYPKVPNQILTLS